MMVANRSLPFQGVYFSSSMLVFGGVTWETSKGMHGDTLKLNSKNTGQC